MAKARKDQVRRYELTIPLTVIADEDTTLHTKVQYLTYATSDGVAETIAQLFVDDSGERLRETIFSQIADKWDDAILIIEGDVEVTANTTYIPVASVLDEV